MSSVVLKSFLGSSTAPLVKDDQVHLSHPRRDKNVTHGHRDLYQQLPLPESRFSSQLLLVTFPLAGAIMVK